jgi:tripartite-type tricarboxylate transporter receptor subunit TctC
MSRPLDFRQTKAFRAIVSPLPGITKEGSVQLPRLFTRRRFSSALMCSLLVGLGAPALGQESFPTRPITIVVPFSAGGTADVLARAIAVRLQNKYGKSVIVENRPGAGGNIGAQVVSVANPDGYTLVLGTVGTHATYSTYRHLNYDPAKDLRPVIVLGEVPCVIAVHPSRPFNDLAQFLTYAKSKPDTLTFGSAGVGSSTHMVGELFQQAAGIKLRHVPYRGSSMAMNDLMAGQIDMMFELITTAAPIVKSGAIRALAVTSRQRSPALPDVPTVDELGIAGFEATGWFTIATAAGVPDPIVAKLNRDIDAILRAPDLQDLWQTLALTVMGGTEERAASFFESERDKWGKVIKAANIYVD